MQAQEAVAKVEEWLRAGGEYAVRVDQAHVLRVPEGWFVPYDTIRALDGGDRLASLVPKPALIVREDGELRRPDTGREGTGPSSPVPMAGEDDWREILEPEFRRSGVAYLGVPSRAVMAWRKYAPDGSATGETRGNPDYRPGPERLGYPPMDTPVDHLLGYLAAEWYDRARYLAGLLCAEVLIPLDFRTEQVLPLLWQEEPRTLRVFGSRRRLPPGTEKWLRLDVLSFVREFPGVGLSINPGSFPSDTVDAAELADAVPRWPDFLATTRVVEVSPEYSESVLVVAERIRDELGLAGPVTGLREAAAKARSAGFELSERECELFVLGRAWEQRNAVPADPAGRHWPDDLHANGLAAGYDEAGRIRPHAATFGKFFRHAADDGESAWHRVAGAFTGFALGESLGSAVDTLGWAEIVARFGENGITGPPGAIRIGPLTRRLLFCTEGLLRALPSPYRGAVPSGLMTVGVRARRREQDGWLSHVPELRAIPPEAPGPGDDAGFLVPGIVAALCGRTAPRVARLLVSGDGAGEETAEAASVVAGLFAGLFQREPAPPHDLARRLIDSGTATGPVAGVLAAALDLGGVDHLPAAGTSAVDTLGQSMAAVFGHFFDPQRTMLAAVNHSGRSAIAGALAGAVAGSRAGIPGLPPGWLARFAARDLVETVAGDAFWHFSAHPPSADEWARRYPRDL
ncbi:YrhB domain-containing protein [Amycolatopsis keratiniphila]|uniref:YrhB domain-containing protein n=1 Tax=Amycolatopsis keratiniphila TaxID=129921 RepID=UPI0008799B5E|nr:YrhB domain-containing protein [Amycolatopsis keratiniphila]OLZ58766.1 ADP-ribosylglycohydrolase [Amycolatopsis keratiniphila subsp. nogabecina]SDU69645.1 ADP-ribosylglycohydrolase [Amycolatopsis keratiniphila]